MSSSLLAPAQRALAYSAMHRDRRVWALTAVAVWLASGIYLVAADQQAVVTTFGAVTAGRVLPGLHYVLPWPISRV